MLTDSDIAAIEQRLAGATPGPWWPWSYLNGSWFVRTDRESVAEDLIEADALLVAHAPADIAALLAEVKRLRRVETAAREWNKLWLAEKEVGYTEEEWYAHNDAWTVAQGALSSAVEDADAVEP